MTVRELLERLDSHELSEWMAFSGLEPFGGDAGYYGHAITAATIYNVNRSKGDKPAKIKDFMPQFSPPKDQTVDDMLQVAAMMTAAFGGQDLRAEE